MPRRWVGDSYRGGALGGTGRLLVVGESHYQWEGQHEGGPLANGLTAEVVRKFGLREEKPLAFFTKVARIVFGNGVDVPTAWRHLAFWNYCQDRMDAPRDPRAAALIASGDGLFADVLRELSPAGVVVLGDLVRGRVFDRAEPTADPLVRLLPAPTGAAPMVAVAHPSRRGFHYAMAQPGLDALRRSLNGGSAAPT